MIGYLLLALFLLLSTLSLILAAAETVLLTAPLGFLYQKANAGQRHAQRILEARTRHFSSCLAVYSVHAALTRLASIAAICGAGMHFLTLWGGLVAALVAAFLLVLLESRVRLVAASRAHRLVVLSSVTLTIGCNPLLVWIPAVITTIARGRSEALSTRSRSALAHSTAGLLRLAAWHGPLARDEARSLSALVAFEGVTVGEVMTPAVAVAMLEDETSLRSALNRPETFTFAALPLYSQTREKITGYTQTKDLLRAALAGTAPEAPIASLRRPLLCVPRSAGIGRALALLAKTNEPIAQVVEASGTVVGLVTRTDLLETVLGVDMADEAQRPSDIHKLAAQLRDRRLAEVRSRYVDLPQA
ncbi:MAG: CBS domain-containing protein [Myxococcota bacterium]|jgi:CBS domain containing-hemolysin-like protein|nr:CBS domain-containing protein [Myxococcota bacterium]